MRRSIALFPFLLLAACAAGGASKGDPPKSSDAPLDFTLPTTAGETVRFEAFRGKAAILDFWASWCEPCKSAMPFYDELQSKYGEQLVVIGVSVDEDEAAMRASLEQRKVHFLIVHDGKGELAAKLGVQTMPSSYLIDGSGVIRKVHKGFVPSDRAAIEAEVARLVAERGGE